MSGNVIGNAVLNDSGIDNIEMRTDECGTGCSNQNVHQQESSTCQEQEISTDGIDNGAYELSPNLRGRVLIIDNFPVGGDQISNADRMKNMWLDLGYLPSSPFRNLTAAELVKQVEKFSKNPYLKNDTSCIVVMIMSFGNEKFIKGSDGIPVSIQELTKKFDVANCRNMSGKPKLFFFEHCHEGEVDVDDLPVQGQALLGNKSDALIVHQWSQQPDIEEGSTFIKDIDRVFREEADKQEIHTLLKKIGPGIQITDTLNRSLYLAL
ncbi:caspase-3-like isoform X2 [Anneissia japonica]|uniref:caspase-3-like isoform X2 n=1 Tax=Anneissia japonica TaxID=1529436 RepID=UPI0014254F4B|nr:caspase-3-like isoform X2 [Anneissia japonica]